MIYDLSYWEEDYEDYVEFYDDDGGKRRKLSKREFCELSQEMMDLVTWQNIRSSLPPAGQRADVDVKHGARNQRLKSPLRTCTGQ